MGNMASVVGSYLSLDQAGGLWKAHCPFHNDQKTKSFVVYDSDAYCFGCGIWMNPVLFLMKYLHISRGDALAKLGDRSLIIENPVFKKKQVKLVDPLVVPQKTISTWHHMLSSHRDYFHSRLFSDETIDREQWGWTGERYVVPVWGGKPGDRCVSVRLRAGNPELEPKYIGIKGYNPRVIYGIWNAFNFYQNYPEGLPKIIYIFFGEFDAALAFQDGFPAVSPTNGQNAWLDCWDTLFEGYQIIVVPDYGEELRGFQVCSRFPGRSSVVRWPKSEDYNDYNSYRLNGGTPDSFLSDIVGRAIQPNYSVECFWDDKVAV